MSSELEKAIERYRQKKQEAQSLAEQQGAAQETIEQERIDRINADFERVVTPVLQRFWSENVPQELVELFDEYAKRIAQRVGKELLPQGRLAIKKPEKDGFLYEESYPKKSSIPESFVKKQVLQILDEAGWTNLELRAIYYLDRTIKVGLIPHNETYYFGFSVTSQNPSSVYWWTGGGDEKIDGEYERTPESLEKVANDLAVALEKGIYIYSLGRSNPSYDRGPEVSGSD